MGCRVVCRRGAELQRHLDACPFSDSTRQVELAQRARWQSIVALQAEQERTRRVVADARATLASAAARAARSLQRDDHQGDGQQTCSSDERSDDEEEKDDDEDSLARVLTSSSLKSTTTPSSLQQQHQPRRRTSKKAAPPGRFSRQAALVRAQQRAAMRALGSELAELWRRHVKRAAPLQQSRAAALAMTRKAVAAAFANMAEALALPEPQPVTVELFGSCAYGLETPDSDLDLVVRRWNSSDETSPNATWVLHRLASQLKFANDPLRVDRVIDRARVPIIRLLCDSVKVDLSLETPQHTGLAAAALCKTLVTRLPALAPVAVAVKQLLRDNGLNDPFTGGLPSYAVVLMLFYSRLHSKHAEPWATKKGPRPFERSSTLRDTSWREATFADLLKKTESPPKPTTPPPPPSSSRKSSFSSSGSSSVSSSSSSSGAALRGKKTTSTPADAFPPPPPPPHDPRRVGEAHALEVLAKAGLPTREEAVETALRREVELAETLLEFLGLFGSDFSPKKEGFSVRHGGRRLVIAPHLRSRGRHRNDHNVLIEDPIDPRNNVGRSSYHVARALDLFKQSHDRLRAAMTKRDHAARAETSSSTRDESTTPPKSSSSAAAVVFGAGQDDEGEESDPLPLLATFFATR
mmetsp:Transcript_22650/g.69639  ORF Transcript_22650/g.69639 Transcript_22650/m.69639 type:complete len:637 (+) Transcript_22650:293-2203(+)